MSFRSRSRNYLRPVNTLKHIVDRQGGLVLDVIQEEIIIHGKDNPVHTTNAQEVTSGSHVKSFFLNIQVAASSTAALANVYMYIYGNPGGNLGNWPKGNVVGVSDRRKNVFHQEMIMTEKNTTAFPRTLFRGVIKIPRKFARIGLEDEIAIQLYAPGVNYDYCIQCIYKEIR